MTHLVIVKRPSKYKHGIKADFTAIPWWTVHFYNAKGELVRNEILVRHIRGIWSSGQIKVVDGIDHLDVMFFDDDTASLLEAKYQNWWKHNRDRVAQEEQPTWSMKKGV